MENKPPFITIAQSLQASFARRVKVICYPPPAAGLCPGAREAASGGDPPVIPDYFDAHSMPAPLPNDGKSSTVAGLNGWQILS